MLPLSYTQCLPQLVIFKSVRGTKATETGEIYQKEMTGTGLLNARLGTKQASVAMEKINTKKKKKDGSNVSILIFHLRWLFVVASGSNFTHRKYTLK